MISGYFNQKYIGGTSMKKSKFNSRAMKEFVEPKVVHEAKPIDLITQYNRMRSIAADIYNSDFYMIAAKAEQKKIEASIACISATMISMIGMEAIKSSHDCLPDDSGNGNDHSWDNLPDDSGNSTDTDKDAHDAIKKMMNIAYGKDETDGVKKAAARQTLNSMYGVLGSHDVVNGEVEFEYTPYESRYINDLATSSFMAKDDIEFVGADDYYKIDKACPNSIIIDLDATLIKIKEKAQDKGIKTITFVGIIKDRHEIYYRGKNSKAGSLYYLKNDERPRFILITGTIDYVNLPLEEHIDPVVIKKNDSEEDDIKFVCAYYYYKIDTPCPNSAIIDLDATLAKIKERARAKNIKTIKFAGTTKDRLNIYYRGNIPKAGSLYYLKNDERPRFILITGTNDSVDLPQYEYIDPVMVVKKDDSEDESDSKEDGIEAVEAEDKIVDSDEASIDHGINDRYANVDTNEISCDNYAKVSFSLFMESTENSENISFVDICNIYDFDVFATIKRIKSVAYLNDLESIKFAGTVYSHEEISEKEGLCDNGSVLFVSDAEDPYFIIIKYCGRTTWLNRINPVEK